MRIRTYAISAVAVALTATICASYSAAQDFSQVQIQIIKAAGGVYMLKGAGGNIGVSVGEDGVFMIDDQFAPLTEKIKEAISTLSESPVKFVINTHWHGDHTGGNENLGGQGAVIVAHENVRKRLTTQQFVAYFNSRVGPYPEMALPMVTFTDAVTFHMNGDEIFVFHLEPAHTDGDAAIFFRRANVLHAGDLYFAGGYPFIDVPNGGSIDGMIAGVEKLLATINKDTGIIPGHGEISDSSSLHEYGHMLRTVREKIKRDIDSGKTLEEYNRCVRRPNSILTSWARFPQTIL